MAAKLSNLFNSKDAFGNLGGAVSDLFGGAAQFSVAKGFKSSAEAYLGTAKTYDEQAGIYGQMADQSGVNARIAGAGQRLKEMQTEREVFKTIGGARSDIAAAGLMESGSALDVLRDSAVQGGLQMGALRATGQLEQAGYKEEALSYQAMGKAAEAASAAAVGQAGMASAQAGAAKKSGVGGILSGALKIGAGLLFSDARLKDPIIWIDDADLGMDKREDGINRYMFKYRGGDQWYVGVLAQEVIQAHPEAVSRDPASGYLQVDYAAIGEHMYQLGSA